MRRFIDMFSACGLSEESVVAGYGLAEATLKVAGTARGPSRALNLSAEQLRAGLAVRARAGEPAVAKVECGTSSPGTEIRIIDPAAATTVPDGTVGEIWSVARACVPATGTARRRRSRRSARGSPTIRTVQPTVRTGLGFRRRRRSACHRPPQGFLDPPGENHYPQDIEATAAAAAPGAGRPTACAFAIDGESEERLVVAVELHRRRPPTTWTARPWRPRSGRSTASSPPPSCSSGVGGWRGHEREAPALGRCPGLPRRDAQRTPRLR